MPQKLGLAARGLSSLFNLQAFGRQPGELEDSIRPGVDVTPFMLADKVFHARSVVSVTARGNSALVIVPVGEIWRPIYIGAFWAGASAIGDILNCAPVYDDFANQVASARVPLGDTTDWPAATAVGDIQRAAWPVENDLLIHAGSSIQLWVDKYVQMATANTLSLEVLYWKFTV